MAEGLSLSGSATVENFPGQVLVLNKAEFCESELSKSSSESDNALRPAPGL